MSASSAAPLSREPVRRTGSARSAAMRVGIRAARGRRRTSRSRRLPCQLLLLGGPPRPAPGGRRAGGTPCGTVLPDRLDHEWAVPRWTITSPALQQALVLVEEHPDLALEDDGEVDRVGLVEPEVTVAAVRGAVACLVPADVGEQTALARLVVGAVGWEVRDPEDRCRRAPGTSGSRRPLRAGSVEPSLDTGPGSVAQTCAAPKPGTVGDRKTLGASPVADDVRATVLVDAGHHAGGRARCGRPRSPARSRHDLFSTGRCRGERVGLLFRPPRRGLARADAVAQHPDAVELQLQHVPRAEPPVDLQTRPVAEGAQADRGRRAAGCRRATPRRGAPPAGRCRRPPSRWTTAPRSP